MYILGTIERFLQFYTFTVCLSVSRTSSLSSWVRYFMLILLQMSRNSLARIVYGVSISVVFPSCPFHFFGAAACKRFQEIKYMSLSLHNELLQLIYSRQKDFQSRIIKAKHSQGNNLFVFFICKFFSDLYKQYSISKTLLGGDSDLVKEGLNAFIFVLCIGLQLVSTNGRDELGLLIQQHAQGGLTLCSVGSSIYPLQLFLSPF